MTAEIVIMMRMKTVNTMSLELGTMICVNNENSLDVAKQQILRIRGLKKK